MLYHDLLCDSWIPRFDCQHHRQRRRFSLPSGLKLAGLQMVIHQGLLVMFISIRFELGHVNNHYLIYVFRHSYCMLCTNFITFQPFSLFSFCLRVYLISASYHFASMQLMASVISLFVMEEDDVVQKIGPNLDVLQYHVTWCL